MTIDPERLGNHHASGRAKHVERPVEVDRHQPAPCLVGDESQDVDRFLRLPGPGDGGLRLRVVDARGMDDHVDTSVLGHGPVHGAFDLGRVGYVDPVRPCGRTGLHDLRRSHLVDVGHDDQGASLRVEPADDGGADSGGSAGDQRDLSGEALAV